MAHLLLLDSLRVQMISVRNSLKGSRKSFDRELEKILRLILSEINAIKPIWVDSIQQLDEKKYFSIYI